MKTGAVAEKAAAQAELDAARDRIEDQVWTAYTNAQTAFAQQRAASALLQAAQVLDIAAVQSYSDGVRTARRCCYRTARAGAGAV